MEPITLESVTHSQNGEDITYVFRAGRSDWFFDILRERPHTNPAWYLLHRRRLIEKRPMRYADFGANVGVTALLPARVGHHVLAVEAGPENVLCLQEAARRNGLTDRLTVAHWAAVGTLGLVTFHEASAWGSTAVIAEHAEEMRETRVPGATAAQILAMHGMQDADVIKMDIEGSELEALTGFETVAQANPGVELVIESNWEASVRHGYRPQDIWARLIAMGFSVYLLEGRRIVPVTESMPQTRVVSEILATRRPAEGLTRLGFLIEPMDPATLPAILAENRGKGRAPEIEEGFIAEQSARIAG